MREGGEPLRPAEPIAIETIGQDGQIVPLEAASNLGKFVRGNIETGRIVERKRRLGKDRREHRRL